MTVVIPADLLTAEALTAVLESVVLREGTDYGDRELSFGEKVARLRVAVEDGTARIVFDPETESVTVVSADSAPS